MTRHALLLATFIAATGSAAAQAPGIADDSIKLGTQAPMSGVVARIGMGARPA